MSFHGSSNTLRANFNLYTGQGGIQLETLRSSSLNLSSTLRYLNGNCTWTISVNLGTSMPDSTFVGSELLLPNPDTTGKYEIICEVNSTVILHAEVNVHAYGE